MKNKIFITINIILYFLLLTSSPLNADGIKRLKNELNVNDISETGSGQSKVLDDKDIVIEENQNAILETSDIKKQLEKSEGISEPVKFDAVSEYKLFEKEFQMLGRIYDKDEYKEKSESIFKRGEKILTSESGGLSGDEAQVISSDLLSIKSKINYWDNLYSVPLSFRINFLKDLNEKVIVADYCCAIYHYIVSLMGPYSKETYFYTQEIKKKILNALAYPYNRVLIQNSLYSAAYGLMSADAEKDVNEDYLKESLKDTEQLFQILKSRIGINYFTEKMYKDIQTTVKFDVTVTMYAKYKKYADAVNELDQLLKIFPPSDNRYKISTEKRAEFLALLSQIGAMEFEGEAKQKIFVNQNYEPEMKKNDEPELKLKIKKIPENVTEIEVKFTFEYDKEKAKEIDDLLMKNNIKPRRYITDYDDKEKSIGFIVGDKTEQEIVLKFNASMQEQIVKFRTTSYCGDKFKINAATVTNNINMKAVKELEIWRKYVLKLYNMRDPDNSLDLSSKTDDIVAVYKSNFVLLVPELQEVILPYKRYIAIDNTPKTDEIALAVYIDELTAKGINFKKQNEYINVIGVDYLKGTDPENLQDNNYILVSGCSYGLIWDKYPFYSIIMANGHLTTLHYSKSKVLGHEIGHRFGLGHESVGNCFMISGDAPSPVFCEACQRQIRNNPLFINDK